MFYELQERLINCRETGIERRSDHRQSQGLKNWPANRYPALGLPFKDKGTCVLFVVLGAAVAEQDKWLATSRTDL